MNMPDEYEEARRVTPKCVLVVDDHAVVRRGLRQLIDDQLEPAACWEAQSPTEALDRAAEHCPDLALVDITLDNSGGGAAGLDLIKRLRRLEPAPRVLAVSMHDETLYARRALAAGAQGYIMKRAPDDELIRAVRRVLDGRTYVSEDVREQLMKQKFEGEPEKTGPVDTLSDRELEVFMLIGRGFAPRHIAEKLHLSVKTVETHRRHLKQKLGLKSSSELTRYAIAWRMGRSSEAADNGES